MIKSWQVLLFSHLMAIIIGAVAIRAVSKSKTIEKIETLTISETYYDTTVVTDTIITNLTDTLIVKSDTPIGDIPVRWHTKRHDIPDGYVSVATQYRGLRIHRQDIEVYPYPKLQLVVAQPFLKFFASLGVFMDIDKKVSGEIAVGSRFANKVSLVCKLDIRSLDYETELKPQVGIRFGL